MDRKRKIVIAISLLLVVVFLGEYCGHYHWFGGSQETRTIITVLEILICLFGCWLLFSKRRMSFLVIPLYFIASQVLFSLAFALGQVNYFGPETWADFKQHYSWALQGRL
ncbi:MAG: hypothetical protein Q7T36_14015 [Fluviicoccus sp.]|uniref:hypothetical protein n=1 Tax=Fluviicoccus sp. TaxID=2003552 RepID=UPI00271E7C74|nr:hypothetical protein [Fluviicoccus sp.]MDO8331576.1 hypothetical protein [Fluviicoccus sp.]